MRADLFSYDRHTLLVIQEGVCHVTFSSLGGAGVVARRLHEGQLKNESKSRLVTMTNRNIKALTLSQPTLVAKALVDFYGVRRTTQSHLFTLYRNGSNSGVQNAILNTRELLHFHWTPGVVSNSDLAWYAHSQRGAVWTLHDMWPFTGGCHHARDCSNYEQNCSECPQVRAVFKHKVVKNLALKTESLRSGAGLYVVAPSQWLASRISASRVLKNAVVNVIPNPIDCAVFSPGDKQLARQHFQISPGAFVIGCSAVDLGDPMKNTKAIVDGVRRFAASIDGKEVVLLAVGVGVIKHPGFQVCNTGVMDSSKKMSVAYQAMDVFVSLSRAESFSLTVAEATATGVPVICISNGGMPEIVSDGENGRVIAEDELLCGVLNEFVADPLQMTKMSKLGRQKALQTFSQELVVSEYDRVYEQVVGERDGR